MDEDVPAGRARGRGGGDGPAWWVRQGTGCQEQGHGQRRHPRRPAAGGLTVGADPRGGGRGRSKKSNDEAEHPDERWMASYMDMITVLMCMFLVLFAMSTVDQQKYIALKNSLATGFGEVKSQKVDTASGTVVTTDEVKDGSGSPVDKSPAAPPTARQPRTRVSSAVVLKVAPPVFRA